MRHDRGSENNVRSVEKQVQHGCMIQTQHACRTDEPIFNRTFSACMHAYAQRARKKVKKVNSLLSTSTATFTPFVGAFHAEHFGLTTSEMLTWRCETTAVITVTLLLNPGLMRPGLTGDGV